MFKRWWVRWGLLGALILLAGAVWFFAVRRAPLTSANCTRIREGMTVQEVEAILGTRPAQFARGGGPKGTNDTMAAYAWPAEDGNAIIVTFFNGRVKGPAVMGRFWSEEFETTWDRFRDWLGW
jgi:hypothetical protein